MVIRRSLILLALFSLPLTQVWAGQAFNPHTGKPDKCLSVSDDATDNFGCGLITVSNGTLADDGDGTYTLTTGGGSGNSFETISVPAGTAPVADSSTDTLTITETSFLTITGTAGTDTIDITQVTTDLGTDGEIVDDSHNHVTTNIDAATSATWAAQITDEDSSGLCAAGVFCMGGHEHAGANLTDDVFLSNAGDTSASNYTWTGDHDFGGGGIEIENGITPPACTVGQLYLDTDATAGQQLMACEGGTFVKQGDGGGSETNDLESVATSAGDAEMFVGTGVDAGAYIGTLTSCAADEKLEYTAGTPDTIACEAIGGLVSADISGLDISADTNLTGGRSLTLTDDDMLADAELYTDTKCKTIEVPTASDDIVTIWVANQAATITGISSETDAASGVLFDLQVDDGTPAAVNGSSITATTSWAEDTTLAGDTTLAAGDRLDLAIASTASNPTIFSFCWEFTYDD